MFGESKICSVCRATQNKDGVDCRTCPFYRCNHLENENQNSDNVNHPAHYTGGSIECIDAMTETQGADAVKNFCICNAFKYLWRHKKKNGVEDVKKAIWYLNKFVELETGKDKL